MIICNKREYKVWDQRYLFHDILTTVIIIVNGGQQILWPPETEITDFDEFLKNTLRAGASPQFSRGHSSSASLNRPLTSGLALIAKSLSLIILYRFTTLHLL